MITTVIVDSDGIINGDGIMAMALMEMALTEMSL
jgi:hypothetical protein